MKQNGYKTIAGLENLTPEEIKQRNLETYGAKIRSFRKRAGLTVDLLAATLGITPSSVRNWECGLTRPDPEYIYRMFTILDIEPNEFFGFESTGASLTDQEKNLISSYRATDKRGQEDISLLVSVLKKSKIDE